MISGKEDLLQSLIEAYLMEKGTHVFYDNAAAKAVNADAQKTFRDLSGWEERHMEYIQSLYLSVQDDRDLKRFEEFKDSTAAPLTEAGIPVKDLEQALERHDFVDEKTAVDIALEIEAKAYNLYRKLAEKAVDSNARVVFKEMMQQEQKHIDYIKAMRDKIA